MQRLSNVALIALSALADAAIPARAQCPDPAKRDQVVHGHEGADPTPSTLEVLARHPSAESERWTALVDRTALKVQ
jgi:hypothetical protein